MNIELPNKLNRLLQTDYLGKLYFASWLKNNGYSDQLLKQYRTSGWLSSLSYGVMHRTGGKLYALPAIASYNEQMGKSFYIGAHSALELSGFNHFVPMGKPLLIVGHPKLQLVPHWLKEADFDCELQFFSTEVFTEPQFYTYAKDEYRLLVSTAEQAFLECLLLAPTRYSFTDLFYIMEQLTTLRPEILQILLENTKNVKVKRMFLYMAQKADHYWFAKLDISKIDLGKGKHQLSKDGVYVPQYQITVPKELHSYE